MTGNLPVVSIPALCPHSDAFAKLLESGDLSMSSVRVDGISMSFQNLLAKICFHHHFSGKGPDGAGGRAQPPRTGGPHALTPARSVAVVERVGSCASLYSRSIQGHHVCLLVKKVSARPPPAPRPPHRAPHVPAAPSAAGRVQPGCSAEARGARGRAHGRPALTCRGTRGPRWELPPILHPLGEALCVRRVCFFLTRFAEFTRETIRPGALFSESFVVGSSTSLFPLS